MARAVSAAVGSIFFSGGGWRRRCAQTLSRLHILLLCGELLEMATQSRLSLPSLAVS